MLIGIEAIVDEFRRTVVGDLPAGSPPDLANDLLVTALDLAATGNDVVSVCAFVAVAGHTDAARILQNAYLNLEAAQNRLVQYAQLLAEGVVKQRRAEVSGHGPAR